ncbi:MAG TPA: hypothetical protein VFV90_07665 [Usitatibacter sp.]|nr:hypothetical protein [Usitatibacter sp.]
MEPLTALAALAPLAVDFGKSLIARFVAPSEFKPATVEQYVTMRKMELELFQAVNAAGGSGSTYLWVEAVKQLMRPAVGVVVMLTWANAHGFLWSMAAMDTTSIDNFASVIGFYLFGDRTLFYARRAIGVGK